MMLAVRSASSKIEPCSEAPVKITEFMLALLKLQPLRSALRKDAPRKLLPTKLTPLSFAPEKLARLRSVDNAMALEKRARSAEAPRKMVSLMRNLAGIC